MASKLLRIKFLREKEGLSGQAEVNELQVRISNLEKTNAGLEGKQEHSKAELKKLEVRYSQLLAAGRAHWGIPDVLHKQDGIDPPVGGTRLSN